MDRAGTLIVAAFDPENTAQFTAFVETTKTKDLHRRGLNRPSQKEFRQNRAFAAFSLRSYIFVSTSFQRCVSSKTVVEERKVRQAISAYRSLSGRLFLETDVQQMVNRE